MVACGKTEQSGRSHELLKECAEYAYTAQFDRCDSVAQLLADLADRTGDEQLKAYSLYYTGVYNFQSTQVEERYKRLQQCESIVEKHRNDSLMLKVYNARGIYEALFFRNYAASRHYITRSMDMARALGDEHSAIVAEQNLSAIMIILNDTLGINYDRDIYDYASRNNDTMLLYASAAHCGIYYSTVNFDQEKANSFAEVLKDTGMNNRYLQIMANVAVRMGDYELAEQYYNELMLNPYTFINFYNYGELLHLIGRHQQSIEQCRIALEEYQSQGRALLWAEPYRLIAQDYAALGNQHQAYCYMDTFAAVTDSVAQFKNREMAQRWRIEYDTAKKEHQLELMQARNSRLWTVLIVSGVAVLIIIGLMAFYYRRQRRMYLNIVRQNKQFMQREKAFNAQTAVEEEPKSEGIAAGKVEILYRRLHEEVVVNQAYKDTTITRDNLAQRLGCSHTYLTQVIKQKTGMTYSQYINTERIREAVRMLSDPEYRTTATQLALDLGFLSAKSFFVYFKQQVGMSPSTFREMALLDAADKSEPADA